MGVVNVSQSGAEWQTYTVGDGLAANWVMSIIEDRNGNLWFGTLGGGVSRYDIVNSQTYTTREGLAGNYLLSILEDHAGNMWFGTGWGLSRYDGTSWTTCTQFNGLVVNTAYALFEDRLGNIWAGGDGGVCRFDGTQWDCHWAPDSLYWFLVQAIGQDRQGNLPFGTYSDGIFLYDGLEWQDYGVVGSAIFAILEDHQGRLWFASNAGVTCHDSVTWRFYTEQDGLAGDYVRAIA